MEIKSTIHLPIEKLKDIKNTIVVHPQNIENWYERGEITKEQYDFIMKGEAVFIKPFWIVVSHNLPISNEERN